MRTKGKYCSVLFATAMLLLSGRAAQAGSSLSSEDLHKLFPGQIVAVWKGKHTAYIDAKANGRVRAKSGSMSDKGKWKINGNNICVKFNLWTWGKYKCGKVWKVGSSSYVGFRRSSGKPRVRFQVK